MAQALEFHFDGDADAAVRGLWRRLADNGVPDAVPSPATAPHVTFAAAGTIPAATRAALREDLRLLSIPSLWLSFLTAADDELALTAVVDTELLAVHSAVHDVLAKRVKQPVARYLPGSWMPHCVLARDLDPARMTAAFAALHPTGSIKARITEIVVVDTHTGETDVLRDLEDRS
ncbi:2'-5' RNA ligase family protein [Actinophytocola glycyrrhizae]|uniref:2'-5' RNA ligase family protein n=1 Tax=Actinophytocola glycyrrhizae TaxID=2044873 RepID=A0ABV9RZG8_9PSEU